jgi:hypothetical protein
LFLFDGLDGNHFLPVLKQTFMVVAEIKLLFMFRSIRNFFSSRGGGGQDQRDRIPSQEEKSQPPDRYSQPVLSPPALIINSPARSNGSIHRGGASGFLIHIQQNGNVGVYYDPASDVLSRLSPGNRQLLNPEVLPKFPFTPSAAPSASGSNAQVLGRDSCAVCMTDFEMGDTLRLLPCLHRYHIECIDPWFKDKTTCPICNQDVVRLLESGNKIV